MSIIFFIVSILSLMSKETLIFKSDGDDKFYIGICLFSSSKIEYGGFNHFIAGFIFRWKYTYIDIYITKKFKYINTFEENYYDGYHNKLQLGFISIEYGT